MKNFTLILIALVLSLSSVAQVLDSDFSSWTDNLPDGWVGIKTNIGNENILAVDNNGGMGDFAVQLTNAASGHKRFTTQPLTVANGENYQITFWARGVGEVRTGLFDNRVDASGYAYSAYVTVNTADWTEYTQNILAAEDYDAAEFILSLRNTMEPSNIQIDGVLIETQEISPVSIYDIQYTTDPSGDSPYAGQSVLTGGIVTAVGADGFFIQNNSGPWEGVFVFNNTNTPVIGDIVTFSASVVEYFNMTQLTGVSSFTIVSSDNALPGPTDISTSNVNDEAYEGCFVKVSNANCVDGNSGFGQFIVNDGSGDALVSPTIYEYDGLAGVIYNITGVIFYNFSEFKIMPRMDSDVEVVTAIAENNAMEISLFPNPVTSELRIEMDSHNFKTTQFSLVDALGKTILSGQITEPNTYLNVNELPAGLYNLNLRTNDSFQTEKVLIQR